MHVLALNNVLPQSMRVKYQIAIAVLPIGLMFASFLLLRPLGSWLWSHFGMPPNSPIKNHPNAGAWIAIFLCSMVALMLLGYAIGWFLNAAIAKYVLGWSTEKVNAVYLQSNVPSHWLKDGLSTSEGAYAQSVAKWETQRKVGALRFIAVLGVLAWGGPMFLAMHLVPTLMKGQGFTMESTLFNTALWACAGAALGAVFWYSSEANYRKLKRRM
jgi:hypothetical protein